MAKHQIREELPIVLGFVACLWVVYLADLVIPINFVDWGLIPRTITGLIGIVTMPFLHGSFGHLISNTVPLTILFCLMAGSRASSLPTIVGIAFLGGLLLWCFGRGNIHVGASGLVYGLISFLILAGILERRPVSIVVALLVGFFYGGTLLWGVLPTAGKDISWDGHLFGALAGGVVAFLEANALLKGKGDSDTSFVT